MSDYPTPTTAREALALVWDLAHPMKEGQEVPIGTECIAKVADGEFMVYRSLKPFDGVSRPGWAEARTLDPLPGPEPDPEPDWLDAPAVLAAMKGRSGQKVWLPKPNGHWECTCCGVVRHWFNMADVTPLWPKEDAAYSSHYDEPWCTWLGGEPHNINEK